MQNRLVYDLPTRLFHWLFAGLFISAFVIANTVDDESPVFAYHMLAGLTLVFAVTLRIIWGFVGTRHARFSSFPLRPKQDLLAYFKGIFGKGEPRTWAGHNPASGWAAIVMMVLALGLGVTGYLMASGPERDAYKEIHELLANTFLAVVLLHLAGIVLHVIRHRDAFALSIVNGRKQTAGEADTIRSAKPLAGLAFAGLVALFAVNLGRNYDAASQSLNLFGVHLQLGENEGDERRDAREAHEKADEDEG